LVPGPTKHAALIHIVEAIEKIDPYDDYDDLDNIITPVPNTHDLAPKKAGAVGCHHNNHENNY